MTYYRGHEIIQPDSDRGDYWEVRAEADPGLTVYWCGTLADCRAAIDEVMAETEAYDDPTDQ